MVGPDLQPTPPHGPVPWQEAFVAAFRTVAGDGQTADPTRFSPCLSALWAHLVAFPTCSMPRDAELSSIPGVGRDFAHIARVLGLRAESTVLLGVRARDLCMQAFTKAGGGGNLPSAPVLFPALDAFLRAVVNESFHLETVAVHKKLREANRFVLRERRRYYSIFKRMAEPACIIDRGLRLLETNTAFDHLFAISGKEHIGKHCYEVLGPEFRAACPLKEILHGRGGVTGIEIDLHIQGQPRSIEVNGTFLGDINHEATGGILILQDITLRRAAEQGLRESELQYRTLIENVPDVTWRVTQEGEFIFVSPNARKIFGFSAEELLADPLIRRSRIHPDDWDLVRNGFTRFLASRLPTGAVLQRVLGKLPGGLVAEEGGSAGGYDVRYRFQKQDGTWVWLHDRASRTVEQGGEWYADGVTSDITALKMAELELKRHHFRLAELVDERTLELQAANQQLKREIAVRSQAEEALMDLTTHLAASNQELDQFAHAAAHDLKEPLMLITAFSGRLAKRHGATLDAKGLEYLKRIDEAAAHMRQLIDSFLSLSQVTSGGRSYEEIDLAELVNEVLRSLEERINESHAQIEIGQLGRLGGDRVQIRQLFQNIIANALKYRKPDGAPRVVLQGGLVDEDYYEILIQDNGIGFDPKDAERIFKPLERLHSRREYEGTGMGLTTCQKIVARHGGEIVARGEPGQGATFIIRLPTGQTR
jgi:PAS domain S-box-containing protein